MWFITVERTEMARVAVVGLIAGLVTPLLALGIANLIINPIFCSSSQGGVCSSREVIGYSVAAIIVAAAATAVLAVQNVYRPLIITLAATVALWGLGAYVSSLARHSWIEYFVFSALLYALAYVVFYWLLRVRNLAISVVAVLAVVALTRWALVS